MTQKHTVRLSLKALGLFLALFSPFSLQAHTIGITQIVDHPSLNAIREGILAQLTAEGFEEGKNLEIIFENAQGNPSIATQIAQKFAGLPLDVVVPITTPSAQSVVQHIKKTPIVFAAISDPAGAKLVGENITGVADTPPIAKQLDFIQKHLPHLKTLGTVYNPGEANSESFLKELHILARARKIKIIEAPAPKSADVQTAARYLMGQVDAIFISNDNTVVSGLEPLVKTCLEAKTPLFVSDPDSVDRGALAAYAYDQREMGHQVGKIVAKVLRGETPKSMPVETPTGHKIYVNDKTAKTLNFHIAREN